MKIFDLFDNRSLFPKWGPVKWCRYCGHKHPARKSCGFEEVTRIAKSGREVTRLVVPLEEEV
jgi:hypothetical protein